MLMSIRVYLEMQAMMGILMMSLWVETTTAKFLSRGTESKIYCRNLLASICLSLSRWFSEDFILRFYFCIKTYLCRNWIFYQKIIRYKVECCFGFRLCLLLCNCKKRVLKTEFCLSSMKTKQCPFKWKSKETSSTPSPNITWHL